jgi:hypothetical protein
MKHLEIISLRVSSSSEQQARQYMRKFCNIVKKHTSAEANSYVNTSIPGDLAIVISSSAEQDKDQGVDLGVCMADVMKQFGLVDHTCWIMMEDQ